MALNSNTNEIKVIDTSNPVTDQVIQEDSNTIIDVNYSGVKLSSLLFLDPLETTVRYVISWQDRFQLAITRRQTYYSLYYQTNPTPWNCTLANTQCPSTLPVKTVSHLSLNLGLLHEP